MLHLAINVLINIIKIRNNAKFAENLYLNFSNYLYNEFNKISLKNKNLNNFFI
jgi:hypothetical protein